MKPSPPLKSMYNEFENGMGKKSDTKANVNSQLPKGPQYKDKYRREGKIHQKMRSIT